MDYNIIIVGCGGIGSALFQDLVRTRIVKTGNVYITLIDGDRVERKNIGRQHFSLSQVGMFKAEALAVTATKVLNLKNLYFINRYVLDVKDIETPLVKCSNTILVGCVDNHSARLIMENYIKRNNYKKTYYLDCSNGVDTGEVVAVYKESRSDDIIGSFRSEYDPNVLIDKTDEKKVDQENEVNCSNEVDEGNEQTIIANRKAAIIALELLQDYINSGNKATTGIVYFKGCEIRRVSRVSEGT